MTQRFSTFFPRLLGLTVLLLCSGCDLEFPEQEVHIRYDAEADTLDMLILYVGVRAENDSEDAVGKGRDRMNRVLAGRREFMFMDWPFYFDLDEEDMEEALPPEAWAAAERVQLVRVEAFLDESQRLCVIQHFRMTGVTAVLADANRLLHEAALRALEAGEVGTAAWFLFDAAEEAEWRAFTEDATPWVSLEGGHLVLRVPATQGGAARALEEYSRVIAEDGEGDRYMFPMLARNIAGLQVSDGTVELRLGRIEGADTVFRSKVKKGPYAKALRELLVTEGLDLSGAPTMAQARVALDAQVDVPESGD